ncbi:MAG: PIG-L deacetylase family protein [Merdimonas faecis]|uniref:PIG-L deacetylase family protein n=1 Tax=Merdimonas faecis TaxID=1653435 RepID=UPI0039905058
MMNVVVFAPHQDDEIIGCFHQIQKMQKNGSNINIIFTSNGNYKGEKISIVRYHESLQALKMCGIGARHIYYMGYDDTGMRMNHSFLWRLYKEADPFAVIQAKHIHTWHPVEGMTLHKMYSGKEALFCKKNFEDDLEYALLHFNPDLILMPSRYDSHGDHKALAYLLQETIHRLRLNIIYFCYLIHTSDEGLWPNRKGINYTKPNDLDDYLWNKRKSFFYSDKQRIIKREAIEKFITQNPFENQSFLLSFAKREEFFLPF